MPVVIPGGPGIAGQEIRPAEVRAPNTGDLGLGSLAGALQEGAKAYSAAEQAKAEAAFSSAQTTFEQGYIPAAKSYDGTAPGFAKTQIAQRDQVFTQGGQGLSDEAKARYDQLSLEHRVKAVASATEVEASAQGAQLEKARAADTGARNAAALAGTLVQTQNQIDAALHGDPTSPTFVTDNLAQIDARHAAALAAAPPQDQAALKLQLAAQRADAQISLAASGRHLLDARVATNTTTAIDTLRNGVEANPAFLPKALAALPTMVAGLPADQREKAQADLPGALYADALNGMASKEDWHGVSDMLARPEVKAALPPQTYAGFNARTVEKLTSGDRALATVQLQDRMASELQSIQLTGKGTGFDPAPAIAAALAPQQRGAALAEWTKQAAAAKTIWATVGDIATLPVKDVASRLALLKPQGGEADFAQKQAVYAQAQAVAQQNIDKRAADPAAAMQASPRIANLWLAAQDGQPADRMAYASATLSQQAAAGVAGDAQHILPVAQAKALINSVQHATGPAKRDALMQVAGYAGSYGNYAGQIFQELGRAGLDRTDLAVLAEAGGDPVAVGAYARGRDKGAALKLEKPQEEALDQAVNRQMKPLASSFATADGGAEHADALRDAVVASARGYIADGDNPNVAAQKAAKLFTDKYSFDPTGWRMPAGLGAQPAAIVDPKTTFAGGAVVQDAGKRTGTAMEAVRLGGQRTVGDLVLDGGKNLQPRGADPRLTPAQKQSLYAATVADRARWATLPDETGLRLVLSSPAGGVVDVLDAKGQPIHRAWSDLQARATRPR